MQLKKNRHTKLWKEENKRKELAEVIGCDEDEVIMFKHCGVVERSVYSRA